jgi:hypothetical protein
MVSKLEHDALSQHHYLVESKHGLEVSYEAASTLAYI